MDNKYLWLFSLPLLLAIPAFFTSCKEQAATLKSKQIQPKVLELYLQSEPLSLDPRVGGNRNSQLVLMQLFEGLTRIDEKGTIHLAQTEKYELSPDGRQYRFTLKKIAGQTAHL